jgi:hypothetical protein
MVETVGAGVTQPPAHRNSLLKNREDSLYANGGSRTSSKVGAASKNITFADEHGAPIAENHFVDSLHYSEHSATVGQGRPTGCVNCVVQ